MKGWMVAALALACLGCERIGQDRLESLRKENVRMRDEISQIAASLPVIEERKARIRKLTQERDGLASEIRILERELKLKSAGRPAPASPR